MHDVVEICQITIIPYFSFREGSIRVRFRVLFRALASGETDFQGAVGAAFVDYLENNPAAAANLNVNTSSLTVTGR